MTIDTHTIDLRGLASAPKDRRLPTVLTVAGSDSSGGAGIEADVKTITAHGCYALTCIAALTAQNTTGVKAIHATPRGVVDDILRANFDDIAVGVVKTGLLTKDAAELLPGYLERHHRGKPLVVDPVVVAASGDALAGLADLQSSIEHLFRRATVITPNLEECDAITSALQGLSHVQRSEVDSVEDLKTLARGIQKGTGCVAVLVKGGHRPFDAQGRAAAGSGEPPATVLDVLYQGPTQTFTVFEAGYIRSRNTHGTGCTLASAIAANLARGLRLEPAVDGALKYVHNGILQADSQLGEGRVGPLNHVFHVAAPVSLAGSALPFAQGHFVDYLLSHPAIAPLYEQYTHHAFVRQVADGTLPGAQFEFYLQQDYAYLGSYARVHSLAASVAPSEADIRAEAEILIKVTEEMQHHRAKLARLGHDVDGIRMGRACQEYADYLLATARGGDWLEINVALAPCLLGYADAARWGLQFHRPVRDDYSGWLADYNSEWYAESCRLGRQVLETHAADISPAQCARLVKIFADVTQLEINFWSAALEHGA